MKKNKIENISILGGGSWGLTLAVLLYEKGFNISVWEFNKEKYESLKKNRGIKFLPYLKLPEKIEITNEINEATKGKDLIVTAVPSSAIRATVQRIPNQNISNSTVLVNVAKGIEIGTFKRLSEVLNDVLYERIGNNIAVISGPSHAEEVSRKIPTSVVVSSLNKELMMIIQRVFNTHFFRIYTQDDIIGVELGGALKNTIALAAGIADGLGIGDNGKAALITRGLAEIRRMGVSLGARPLTFSGLSGLGDLVVTCISKYSRNRNFGEKLAKGIPFRQALKEIEMVVEGIPTTKAVYELSRKKDISMPITEQVYNVLFNNKDPKETVNELMGRQLKSEVEL